jgi:RimJ/RimL family protein N-acetyltransferase
MELRKVCSTDAELLFNWVNDFEVRKNSINSGLIIWEDHIKWLQSKIESYDTLFYIAKFDNIEVGQIRFEFNKDCFVIDYSIDKSYRAKGLGRLLIQSGVKRIEEETDKKLKFIAIVKNDNIASNKIFEKMGFEFKGIKIISNSKCNLFELKL